jgi:hypothetical protein
VLFEGQYRKAKAKGECPNTKAAVLIDGKGAGCIFYVCHDSAKARAAYNDFFALWKDADPDIPILQRAKAEYSNLK